jgi:hypothetical protein
MKWISYTCFKICCHEIPISDLCLDLYFRRAMCEALAPKSLQIHFLEVLILVHIKRLEAGT